MARSFYCAYRGEICFDPNCKKSYCLEARQDRMKGTFSQPVSSISTAPSKIFSRELRKVARDWLVWIKGVNRPTEEQLLRVSRLPKAVEEAERRIRERNATLNLLP
jgi:hypothetical protein